MGPIFTKCTNSAEMRPPMKQHSRIYELEFLYLYQFAEKLGQAPEFALNLSRISYHQTDGWLKCQENRRA